MIKDAQDVMVSRCVVGADAQGAGTNVMLFAIGFSSSVSDLVLVDWSA